jgi:hypothetical protein
MGALDNNLETPVYKTVDLLLDLDLDYEEDLGIRDADSV